MPKAMRLKEKPKKTSAWGQMDMPFFLLVVVLVVVGLIMLLSASYPTAIYDIKNITGGDAFYYFKRQAVFAAGGIAVMIFVSRLNYQGLRDMTRPVAALGAGQVRPDPLFRRPPVQAGRAAAPGIRPTDHFRPVPESVGAGGVL